MAKYISAPQQWNRYAYVANNPLKYIDPTGELLELTGETEDERKEAFERIKVLAGSHAKDLWVGTSYDKDGKAHYYVNSNIKKGTPGLAGYLEDIIYSNNTVEYKIAEHFTLKSGETLSTAGNRCGGACTIGSDESQTGHTQIFVNRYAGAISEGVFNSPQAVGWFKPDNVRVWSENDIVDAHEFGHAYGNAVEGRPIRNSRDTYQRAIDFENLQRATYPTRRKVIRVNE